VKLPGPTRLVCGFQHEADARAFLADLSSARMKRFALSLHPEKTRLIEFGRFAAESRKRRGLGRPETFAFLGFLHICGRTRRSRTRRETFLPQRKTRSDRMRAKLNEIKSQLRSRMHATSPRTGSVARQGRAGVFCLPRDPEQRPVPLRVPTRCHRRVAAGTPAPQSTRSHDLGGDAPAGQSMAAGAAHPASLAQCSICRQTPKVGAEWCVTSETSVVGR
jgi:hypothetical protein